MSLIKDHQHSPEAIQARLRAGPKASYLRDWVYGGIDGVVTTFAIAAGAVGADLSPSVVLILGLANLVGDGFSMAAANYSGTRAEIDNYERLRESEIRHIGQFPEGEKEEIRQIYAAKGLTGEELERMVGTVTGNRDMWLDVMLMEEFGAAPLQRSSFYAALSTFTAFVVCGTMPLVPFLFSAPGSFAYATILSALTFFAIGSFKSIWSVRAWWRSGTETMLIGLCAAGLAFVIGWGLRGLAG